MNTYGWEIEVTETLVNDTFHGHKNVEVERLPEVSGTFLIPIRQWPEVEKLFESRPDVETSIGTVRGVFVYKKTFITRPTNWGWGPGFFVRAEFYAHGYDKKEDES